MTYRELRKYLQEMDDMRLDDDATIFDKDNEEYIPARSIQETGEDCDVLDEGHTIIVI